MVIFSADPGDLKISSSMGSDQIQKNHRKTIGEPSENGGFPWFLFKGFTRNGEGSQDELDKHHELGKSSVSMAMFKSQVLVIATGYNYCRNKYR